MATEITHVLILYFILCNLRVMRIFVEAIDRETCDFSGTTADSSDCTAYYHCVEGKLYHYRCGAGSVFDKELLSCVSPAYSYQCDKAKALPQIASKEASFVCQYDGYFPDPTDCRRFYRCSGSTKHAFSCPDDMGFNPNKITCDPIETVLQCGLEGFISSGDKVKKVKDLMLRELTKNIGKVKVNSRDIEQSVVKQLDTSGFDYSYATNPFRIKNGNIDIHRNTEHAQNTQGFRQGTFYRDTPKKDLNIANNLYSPENKFDYPDYYVDDPKLADSQLDLDTWNEFKNGPYYPKPGDPGPNTVFPWGDPTPGDKNLNTKQPAGKFRSQRRFVKGNFRKRYKLRSNKGIGRPRYNAPPLSDKHLRKVAKGVKMESKSRKKDFTAKPEMYGNFNNRYGKQGGVSFKNYNIHHGHRDIHTNLNLAKPFRCPYDGYFRDEDDCTRFYHCTHGIPYLVKCNGGLYFNPANKICDWPARVAECSQGKMRKVFASPKLVRLDDYKSSRNTKGSEVVTGKDENELDSKKAVSVQRRVKELNRNILDQADIKVIDTCPVKGFIRDRYDCTKFYVCTDTEKISYSCGAEMAFHSELKACVNAQYVTECKYSPALRK